MLEDVVTKVEVEHFEGDEEGLEEQYRSVTEMPDVPKSFYIIVDQKSVVGEKETEFEEDICQPLNLTYNCTYCDYSTPKRFLLSRHMKRHSDERPFMCNICEKGFIHSSELQSHMNTHTGIKKYKCKHCVSSFMTSGEVVRHTRYKHTHQKPHKCIHCEYTSVEKSKLMRHLRIHTGEGGKNISISNLRTHVQRLHSNELILQCNVCNEYFQYSYLFESHKQIHIGEKRIKCELCPYSSIKQIHLDSHMLTHTNQTIYCCGHCDHTFTQKQLLRRHYKLLHNPEENQKERQHVEQDLEEGSGLEQIQDPIQEQKLDNLELAKHVNSPVHSLIVEKEDIAVINETSKIMEDASEDPLESDDLDQEEIKTTKKKKTIANLFGFDVYYEPEGLNKY